MTTFRYSFSKTYKKNLLKPLWILLGHRAGRYSNRVPRLLFVNAVNIKLLQLTSCGVKIVFDAKGMVLFENTSYDWPSEAKSS